MVLPILHPAQELMEIFISIPVPIRCLDLRGVEYGHPEYLWWVLRERQAHRDFKDFRVLKALQEF